MDAKFYQNTLASSQFGKESIRSGHLYQIFSYLKNIASNGGNDASAEGVLLYPTVGRHLSNSYKLLGHSVRIETVDLGQEWRVITDRLMQIAYL